MAFDTALPEAERFAACRTLMEVGERPASEPPEGWWPYVTRTGGAPPEPVESLAARSWEVLAHLDCTRRAFMQRFSSGRGSTGRMSFGSAFKEGVRRYLSGEHDSLEEAVLGAVGEKDFGGPAFGAYWERQARETLASCEEWATGVRETLVSGNGSCSLAAGEHEVRGEHGPIVREDGERVVLRVSTSKYPASYADEATDPALALQALGAEADGAKLVYPRKLSRGKPAERPLDTGEGREEAFEGEVRLALAEMAAGEMPARPRDERLCDGCAFRIACPLHAEDDPWLG